MEKTFDKRKLSDMKSVTVWFEPGVGTGHINATIARMKELCSLGFNGSFDIIYLSNGKQSGPPEEIAKMIREESGVSLENLSLEPIFSPAEYVEPHIIKSSLDEKFPGKIKSFTLNDDLTIVPTVYTLCISGAADQTSEAPIKVNQISLLRAQMDVAFGCEVMIQLQPARWRAGQSYIKHAYWPEREILPALPHKIDDEISAGFNAAPERHNGQLKIACYGLDNLSHSKLIVPTLVKLSKDTEFRPEISEVGIRTSTKGFIPKGILSKPELGEVYAEIDLMVCEGQNTASECLALGVPVLHLPKDYAGNIYPSDNELLGMGFKFVEDKNVFNAVHAMRGLTEAFIESGSTIDTLSDNLKNIRQLVDRSALLQLAEKINAQPSPLQSALIELGLECGVAARLEEGKSVTLHTKEALHALHAAKEESENENASENEADNDNEGDSDEDNPEAMSI